MAKNLGARTVMIMNQAKQEVERREETEEEESKTDTEKNTVQTENNSGSLQSVGKLQVCLRETVMMAKYIRFLTSLLIFKYGNHYLLILSLI